MTSPGVLTPSDLTPTEKRVWDKLMDGAPHPTADLKALLPNEDAELNSLEVLLTRLRKKCGRFGFDVVHRRGTYRLMRTIGDRDEQ